MKKPNQQLITIACLPNEMLDLIFDHLNHEELFSCSQVNEKWFDLINEKLLRTESCLLIKNQNSLRAYETNRMIKELVVMNVDNVDLVRDQIPTGLKSFYLKQCKLDAEKVFEKLDFLLQHKETLVNVTLKLHKNINLLKLENFLLECKQVENICLIFNKLDEIQKEKLVTFFNNCYFFYNEIVVQILEPVNEIIYIVSNKDKTHKFIQTNIEQITCGQVGNSLIQQLLEIRNGQLKQLHLTGGEHCNADTLHISRDLEVLTLNNFCDSTQQSWQTFFKMISNESVTLKELNILNCENVTCSDLSHLKKLNLHKLKINLEKCLKICQIESFVEYCLQHVSHLSVSFNYNENYLTDLIKVFESLSKNENFTQLITKCVDIEVQRFNHSSEKFSRFLDEFKSKLYPIAHQLGIKTTISESFRRIRC